MNLGYVRHQSEVAPEDEKDGFFQTKGRIPVQMDALPRFWYIALDLFLRVQEE